MKTLACCAAVAAALCATSTPARVAPIVNDTTAAIAGQTCQEVTGRAFGELAPRHAQNAEITALGLAPPTASANVEYVASVRLRKPIHIATTSGLMWHDVPNR